QVTIRGEDIDQFREHRLSIHNAGTREMRYWEARLQFPEPLIKCRVVNSPIGSSVRCVPDRMEFIASGSAGGSISVQGRSRPPLDVKMAIDILPSRGSLVLHLVSQHRPDTPAEPREAFGPDALIHYLSGQWQVTVCGQSITRQFLVPLM